MDVDVSSQREVILLPDADVSEPDTVDTEDDEILFAWSDDDESDVESDFSGFDENEMDIDFDEFGDVSASSSGPINDKHINCKWAQPTNRELRSLRNPFEEIEDFTGPVLAPTVRLLLYFLYG